MSADVPGEGRSKVTETVAPALSNNWHCNVKKVATVKCSFFVRYYAGRDLLGAHCPGPARSGVKSKRSAPRWRTACWSSQVDWNNKSRVDGEGDTRSRIYRRFLVDSCSGKMKFAEHLSSHITPEWRKQYLQYEVKWNSSFIWNTNLVNPCIFLGEKLSFWFDIQYSVDIIKRNTLYSCIFCFIFFISLPQRAIKERRNKGVSFCLWRENWLRLFRATGSI